MDFRVTTLRIVNTRLASASSKHVEGKPTHSAFPGPVHNGMHRRACPQLPPSYHLRRHLSRGSQVCCRRLFRQRHRMLNITSDSVTACETQWRITYHSIATTPQDRPAYLKSKRITVSSSIRHSNGDTFHFTYSDRHIRASFGETASHSRQ